MRKSSTNSSRLADIYAVCCRDTLAGGENEQEKQAANYESSDSGKTLEMHRPNSGIDEMASVVRHKVTVRHAEVDCRSAVLITARTAGSLSTAIAPDCEVKK